MTYLRHRALAIGLLISACLVFACGKKKPNADGLPGTWSGTYLIVGVHYTFTENTYEAKTTSFNNIMIGGTRGTYTHAGTGRLKIHQTEEYGFDNALNKGAWAQKTKDYVMEYEIKDDNLRLKPSTSDDAMTLSRQ